MESTTAFSRGLTKMTKTLQEEIEALIKDKSITISKDFNMGLYVKAEHLLALASKLGETHVLVPKEPTKEMLKAAYLDDKCFQSTVLDRFRSVYLSMLSNSEEPQDDS